MDQLIGNDPFVSIKNRFRACEVFINIALLEQISQTDPTALLETPKLAKKLPDLLSFTEIEKIIAAVDVSTPEGTRNKAIIETLYSCGLRVSELVNLKLSCLYPDVGYVRVIGKGDKERLVPIGSSAIKYIHIYKENIRVHVPVIPGNEDFVFLNRRGRKLSRVMIFMIIKDLAKKACYYKKYFATYFSAFFCNTSGGRWRRPSRCTGNAGARKYYHY